MPKYRITVAPSQRPNEGDFEFVTELLRTTRHGQDRIVAQGYGTSPLYAQDAGKAAAQRHFEHPPLSTEVEYDQPG